MKLFVNKRNTQQRRHSIIAVLNETGEVSVDELANRFETSEVTIRKDLAVLGARMVKQLEYTWPALNPQYREFGRPVYLLSSLLYWLPTQAWNFTLAIQGGPGAVVQLLRPTKSPLPINNHLATCALAAKVLNTELGGPQKFAGQRVDIARIGTGPKPTPHTITAALRLLRLSKGIWVLSVLLIPCLWATLRLLAHA